MVSQVLLEDFADKAVQLALQNGIQYCDVRAETIESNGFLLEDGQIEHFSSKFEAGLGIRILADGAWGFYSLSNPKSVDELKDGVISAIKYAFYYAQTKKQKVKMAETRVCVDTVDYGMIETPEVDEMTKLALECDGIIRVRKRIKKSSIHMHHDIFDKYFVNSEGAFPITITSLNNSLHSPFSIF